jgi:VWFA-related protein
MKRRWAIRSVTIAGAVLCFSLLTGHILSQQTQSQANRDFVIRSDVKLVLLDVAVKDRTGGLVGNLTRDNFTVLENGQRQQITAFANDDVPVTVGILVDESRSMMSKRNEVLTAAGDFIRTSNPRDEMFVLNFNDDVKRGLPSSTLFSDNADQLRAALDRGVPRGMTALNDAVVAGLEQLALAKRAKKALVLISDGGDNASAHTRSQMFHMVEGSPATVYAVGLLDPADPDRNPRILQHLAYVSGGEAFLLEGLEGLTPTCEAIAKEIRTRYTIGYVPTAGKPGSLRHIQVRVSAPGKSGLVARTRTSYRYEDLPDAASK